MYSCRKFFFRLAITRYLADSLIFLDCHSTVKLANSASPFKFQQVKFVLRMIECVFPEHGQLNFGFGLAELANLSVSQCCRSAI